MKIIFTIIFVFASLLAQLKVVNSRVIETNIEAYYPIFGNNDDEIYFTTSQCIGIYKFNLSNNKFETITEDSGAGYEFRISGDKIVYRKDNYSEGKKYSSIIFIDLTTREQKILLENKRNISTPEIINKDYVIFNEGSNNKIMKVSQNRNLKSIASTYVLNEDLKIALYMNGKKRILKPVGDDNYIWISLSPDKTKILFTASSKGTFICDLSGNILYELGKAQSPKWSPDGKKILYMIQQDDGHQYTASELYYYDLKEKKHYQLTKTDNVIELYPSWSKNGDKIVCNTADGKIILYELQ